MTVTATRDHERLQQLREGLTDSLREATPQLRGALDGVAALSRSINANALALAELLSHARAVSQTSADRANRPYPASSRANRMTTTTTTVAEAAFPPEAPRGCPLCPRLAAYREDNRRKEPASWFNDPVPSFGDETARLLIVGLAPGRTGANRTGRPFTGDHAGVLLYGTLKAQGFAEGYYQARPDDGLRLVYCMITNAVR